MRVAERSAPAVLRGPRRVRDHRSAYAGAVHLSLVAIVVEEYDPAIGFFVGTLGFPALRIPCPGPRLNSPADRRVFGSSAVRVVLSYLGHNCRQLPNIRQVPLLSRHINVPSIRN